MFQSKSFALIIFMAFGGLLHAEEPDPKAVQDTLDYLRAPKSGHGLEQGAAKEMEQELVETVMDYPGWEGFALKHWRYKTPARGGISAHQAEVLMLNPTLEQLSRWIVIACLEAKGEAKPEFTHKLAAQIIGQSGGQFPVAGIVYEDMDGKPYETYGFRDGVTVGFEKMQNAEARDVTKDEIAASLDRKTPLRYTGSQARLQSTTRAECREMYLAAGGKRNPNAETEVGVVDQVFLDINRKSYQEGWKTGRHAMMIAWARANLN